MESLSKVKYVSIDEKWELPSLISPNAKTGLTDECDPLDDQPVHRLVLVQETYSMTFCYKHCDYSFDGALERSYELSKRKSKYWK